MSILKSWSQEHPKEPVIVLVTLCAVLAAYVHMASPEPHYDPSVQVKYTEAKTLPTAGPLPVEAPVQGRRVKPVALAIGDDSGIRNNFDRWGCPLGTHYTFYPSRGEAEDTGKCRDDLTDQVITVSKQLCHKEGGWWIASGDEGLFWTKTQCEAWPAMKPTFHPDPNSVWL